MKPPPRSAASTSAYCNGLVTTATLAWFFAAARTMAGPPMSISSTHCSGGAPLATVDSNGYRFDTSSWNGSMPSSSSWLRCSGRRRSASSPAWTRGCSVLTRPSRHSGNPVSSSTLVTGTPVPAMTAAVLPVETISTPASCSPRASSSSPVLS